MPKYSFHSHQLAAEASAAREALAETKGRAFRQRVWAIGGLHVSTVAEAAVRGLPISEWVDYAAIPPHLSRFAIDGLRCKN